MPPKATNKVVRTKATKKVKVVTPEMKARLFELQNNPPGDVIDAMVALSCHLSPSSFTHVLSEEEIKLCHVRPCTRGEQLDRHVPR